MQDTPINPNASERAKKHYTNRRICNPRTRVCAGAGLFFNQDLTFENVLIVEERQRVARPHILFSDVKVKNVYRLNACELTH